MSDNSIKEVRKRKGITQVELAKMLGVTQGAVQKLESGENDLTGKMLRKLATVLNVDAWELLPKDMQPNITAEEAEVLRAIRKAKEITSKTNEISSTTKAS
jgi:transcriptional regulator with XRE-family HTH domain